MTFVINGNTWRIIELPEKELTERYNSEHDDKVIYTFGVTKYPIQEIWINQDMCEAQKIKTLKHELTHCYIWERGLYYIENYTDEMVCELVASINGFINEVVEKFKNR